MSKSGIPIVSDVAKAVKPIVQPIAKAIRPLAPILPFIPIPGMFGLSSLLTKSLLTGALGGLDRQGKFDFGRGLKSGLLAYGIGSLMQPAAAASGSSSGIAGFGEAADEVGGAFAGSAPSAGIPVSAGESIISPIAPSSSGITSLPSVTSDISTMPVSETLSTAQMDPAVLRNLPADATAAGPVSDVSEPVSRNWLEYAKSPATGGEPSISSTARGIGLNAPANAAEMLTPAPSFTDKVLNYASQLPGKALDYVTDPKNIIPVSLGATTAYGSIKSMQDLERQKKEAERILQNREKEKAEDIAYAESVLRDYPLLYKRLTEEDVRSMNLASGGMADFDDESGYDYAYGGLAGLAGGGLPPRYLRGGGDGMSDSIRARIGGRQEARLADGEFVVPADVVSHIGNGSSNAGAKKLYAMMDRARQARTGRKRQAPAVKAERYMPA
jgi:hypothetical protein